MVHEVALTPGSLLAKIMRKRVLGVNSSHHQAVVRAGGTVGGRGAQRAMESWKRWN